MEGFFAGTIIAIALAGAAMRLKELQSEARRLRLTLEASFVHSAGVSLTELADRQVVRRLTAVDVAAETLRRVHREREAAKELGRGVQHACEDHADFSGIREQDGIVLAVLEAGAAEAEVLRGDGKASDADVAWGSSGTSKGVIP